MLALLLFQYDASSGESNSVAAIGEGREAAEATENQTASALVLPSVDDDHTRIHSPVHSAVAEPPRSRIRNARWQGVLRSSLAARSQIDTFDWEAVPVYDVGPEFEPNKKAIHEMIEEFLPPAESKVGPLQHLPFWKWFSQTWGEVI